MADEQVDLPRTLEFKVDLSILLQNNVQELNSLIEGIHNYREDDIENWSGYYDDDYGCSTCPPQANLSLIVDPFWAPDDNQESTTNSKYFRYIGMKGSNQFYVEDFAMLFDKLTIDLSLCNHKTQLQLLASDGLGLLSQYHCNDNALPVLYQFSAPDDNLLKKVSVICSIGEISNMTISQNEDFKMGPWSVLQRVPIIESKTWISACETIGAGISIKEIISEEHFSGEHIVPILGCTLMHLACLAGDADCVEYFVHNGTSVDIRDEAGRTPLHYAVNSKVVTVLLKHGAVPEASHLFYHCRKDKTEFAQFNHLQSDSEVLFDMNNSAIIRCLLEAGVPVNTTDNDGKTPIFFLLEDDNILPFVIKAGANMNATDYGGKTPLFYSLDNIKSTSVLLEAEASLDVVDKDGKTVIFHALTDTRQDVLHLLIKKGANVNATDYDGKTPLFHSLQYSENITHITQVLIEAGANINHKDQAGNVVLFQWLDNEEILDYLINNGADINARDIEGRTALFRTTKPTVTRSLLQKGANVNATDIYGRTALYRAFETSHELVCVLLESGANVHLTDKCGLGVPLFAMHVMLKRWDSGYHHSVIDEFDELLFKVYNKLGLGSTDIFQVIIDAVLCHYLRLKCPTSLEGLCGVQKALNCAILYSKKCDNPDVKIKVEEILNLLLHGQSSSSVTHICKVLLHLGANPNSPDDEGNTALFYAVCLAHLSESGLVIEAVMSICDHLVQSGSVTWTRNYCGETPLLYLMSRYWYNLNLPPMLKFLFSAGSNASEMNDKGQSVYHLAIERAFGYDRMMEMEQILKFLSSQTSGNGLSVNIGDDHLNTPLHLWASMDRNKKTHGSNPVSTREHFSQFLANTFKLLLSCGAKLMNSVNLKAETPVHLCTTWCAMKLLLEAGANPQVLNAEGDPPLLAQLKRLQQETYYDIDSPNIYPDASELEPEMFWEQVIGYKLDLWPVKGCKSVLSVLIHRASFQLADSLLRTVSSTPGFLGPVASSALFDICKDMRTETYWKVNLVDTLMKLGINANVTNQKGETPLHLSCKNAVASRNLDNVHHAIVQRLLMYGADCNIQDATGATCLELASESPELEATLWKPFDINEIPLLIPWNAKSDKFKPLLAQVARRKESDQVEAYHFHKDPIGSGAYGFVHAGINSKDGREIAIKSIRRQHMIRPEDRREIENLTKLEDCSHVLGYLGCTEDQHFMYIVLELMDGNLDEYLDSSPDPAHNVKLCKDVAMGIEFLHRNGILHRDLKPGNILYKAAPLCLKIADFGLSSKSNCCLTLTATVLHTNAGTRCWMAPELMKEKSVDKIKHTEHSDMFACGLVLYYILSGKKHPFAPADCTDKSPMEIQTETESNVLGFRPSIGDSLSAEASHLVSEMISNNKDQRITATDALAHPLFWSNCKKVKLIEAVGNQKEIGAPRSKATSLSVMETDLESSFVSHLAVTGTWNAVALMPQIYMEMTSSPKSRKYNTKSCVALVRFIRNAYAHVSESHPTRFKTLLLEDFVFFNHFPWLVMAVYKAVMKAGWHQTREEVKAAMNSH